MRKSLLTFSCLSICLSAYTLTNNTTASTKAAAEQNEVQQILQSKLFTKNRGRQALNQEVDSLNDDELDQFTLGRSFFAVPWVEAPAATKARDGLGPLFNGNTCLSCHRNNGGGELVGVKASLDRSLVFKFSRLGAKLSAQEYKNNGTGIDSSYGGQLAINGIHGVDFEATVVASLQTTEVNYSDGKKISLHKPNFEISHLNYGELDRDTKISPRRALPLVGLGLISQISDQQILSAVDEDDANGDGISGRANKIWSRQNNDWKVGRFGWKATSSTVIGQTAKALSDDMGLTSRWYPLEVCSENQKSCKDAYSSTALDIPFKRLSAIAFYLKNLKVPTAEVNPQGKKIFQQAGCGGCHKSNYTLASGVKVEPYSDFLLHDMGPELADNMTAYLATSEEWRTPPLWGIGLAKRLNSKAGFLHDGRAGSLEQAIMWHGGEALKAKTNFASLPAKERQLILGFLGGL